jgi:hypothetical protein
MGLSPGIDIGRFHLYRMIRSILLHDCVNAGELSSLVNVRLEFFRALNYVLERVFAVYILFNCALGNGITAKHSPLRLDI